MKKQQKRGVILSVLLIVLLLIIVVIYSLWNIIFNSECSFKGDNKVYINRNITFERLVDQLVADNIIEDKETFKLTGKLLGFEPQDTVLSGCYSFKSPTTYSQFLKTIKRGEQVPVKLTINYMRLPEQFASKVSSQLMIDSAEIMEVITDTMLMDSLFKCKPEHIFTLMLRNTYEVWWNTSAINLIKKLKEETDKFWNNSRIAKAEKLGLTIPEVITLASIVEEETNYQPEKPRVAGLYLNRLKKGMRLQSDPTVKFALKDFTLNQILNRHLEVDDPYNTYKYKGLPPGPIRLPSNATIDAVLNAEDNKYIYMCANENFDGTHNFARTLSEHNKNAAKYHKALKIWLKKKNNK